MSQIEQSIVTHNVSALQTNKVLRNTYMLLSMTLLFSAVMAGLSMALNVPYGACLLYTSPSPRDGLLSRMPSSA